MCIHIHANTRTNGLAALAAENMARVYIKSMYVYIYTQTLVIRGQRPSQQGIWHVSRYSLNVNTYINSNTISNRAATVDMARVYIESMPVFIYIESRCVYIHVKF